MRESRGILRAALSDIETDNSPSAGAILDRRFQTQAKRTQSAPDSHGQARFFSTESPNIRQARNACFPRAFSSDIPMSLAVFRLRGNRG